jgi:acyl-CoA synthetase (AMP-forming)/AMP-acid ligase II
MPPSESAGPASLWDALSAAGRLSERRLWSVDASISPGDLVRGSSLGGRLEELRGRSVLVATGDQLAAALALMELDGVARRLILCPPDLPLEYMPLVISTAAVDAVVSDRTAAQTGTPGVEPFVTCTPDITPGKPERSRQYATEWILMTSGTTGPPKMVVHTLASLAGAIKPGAAPGDPITWSTFYDIRRYGGLQILLRALLGGGSLVLSSAGEAAGDFLARAGARAVTHILGTPTHWRTALMSPSARRLAPRYVRLSGEISDQTILDHLRAFYPGAAVVHAYASTEAGVGFEVSDGLAGFPAQLIGQPGASVEMKIEEGSLRIRSTRAAARYLGGGETAMAGADGFVDTGDMVELRGERYYFAGRRGGIINVGGQKVHPEEVEAVINSHPQVRISLVRAKKNSFTGALVVAEVVLNADAGGAGAQSPDIEQDILRHCRAALPRHKVPATITFVASLALASSGKIARRNA